MKRPKPTVRFYKRLHGWLTVFWGVMIPISVLTSLKNSLPYLVLLSVYALMGSHFAAWQGTRAEDNSNGSSQD